MTRPLIIDSFASHRRRLYAASTNCTPISCGLRQATRASRRSWLGTMTRVNASGIPITLSTLSLAPELERSRKRQSIAPPPLRMILPGSSVRLRSSLRLSSISVTQPNAGAVIRTGGLVSASLPRDFKLLFASEGLA